MAVRKRIDFYSSDEGVDAYRQLKAMEADANFVTRSAYAADTSKYPDNTISFVDKHMTYLHTHPNTDVQGYISNLRLMNRIKR